MIGKNNIFNIRYSPANNWLGQVGQTRGFVDFQTNCFCIRAMGILLMRSYRREHVISVHDIISRFAPVTENDTAGYIRFVCSKMKCAETDKMNSVVDYCRLMFYIQKMECGGYKYSWQSMKSILDYYCINPIKIQRL